MKIVIKPREISNNTELSDRTMLDHILTLESYKHLSEYWQQTVLKNINVDSFEFLRLIQSKLNVGETQFPVMSLYTDGKEYSHVAVSVYGPISDQIPRYKDMIVNDKTNETELNFGSYQPKDSDIDDYVSIDILKKRLKCRENVCMDIDKFIQTSNIWQHLAKNTQMMEENGILNTKGKVYQKMREDVCDALQDYLRAFYGNRVKTEKLYRYPEDKNGLIKFTKIFEDLQRAYSGCQVLFDMDGLKK